MSQLGALQAEAAQVRCDAALAQQHAGELAQQLQVRSLLTPDLLELDWFISIEAQRLAENTTVCVFNSHSGRIHHKESGKRA